MGHPLEEFYDPHSPAGLLAAAAARGDTVEVARLVTAGADPNAPGRDGMLPLHWAYMARSDAGVRALLTAGADPNRRNLGPRLTPGSGAGVSPIAFAVTDADTRWLALYLAHGGNPNGPGRDGDPLIFDAIGTYDLAPVRLLVEHGADLNSRGVGDFTPVTAAAGHNQFPIVRYLLERGADWRLEGGGGTLAFLVQDHTVDPQFTELADAQRWVRGFLETHGVRFPVPDPAEQRRRNPAQAKAPA